MAEIDELNGAEAEAPDDDLASIIDGAIDGAEAAPATEAAPETAPDTERDEFGRFKKKLDAEADDNSAEAAPDPEPSAEASVSAETSENAKPVSEWTDGHFRGFSDEDRSAFMGLPKEAQEVSMRLIQGRDQHWQGQVQEWESFGQQVSPLIDSVREHLPRIQAQQADPAEYVRNVLIADQALQTGTYAEKLNLVAQIAQMAGVPVQIPEADPYADPTQPGGEAYAAIHDAKISAQRAFEQSRQYQQELEQLKLQQIAFQWDSFKSQYDATGAPRYPEAENYRQEMAIELQQGRARSLEEAYKAVSDRYDAIVSKRVEERLRSQQQQTQQAVQRAKAARPIKTTGSQTNGKSQADDLSSLIYAQMDAAGIN